MHRVDTSSAVQSLPAVQAQGTPGFFRQGDPTVPNEATVPGPDWLNMLQEELYNVVVQSGITPDATKTDFTQVYDAILALRSAGTLGGLADVFPSTPQSGEALIYNGTNWANGVPATTFDALGKKLTLNGLMDTISTGQASQYIDTFSDPYANTLLIDTVAATGQNHDAVNATLHNVSAGIYSANLIPTMTSNIAPEGVASSFSLHESNFEFFAFNKVTAGAVTVGWQASGTSAWLQYQFALVQTISRYTIVGWTAAWTPANRAPQNWTLQASNTGAFSGEEVILDTQTGQTGWGDTEKRTFSFVNANAYLYYRIVISLNNGGATTSIIEMEMMASTASENMVIPSALFATLTVPTRGKFIGLIEPVDALTYGVDLTVEMTRNDGTAWDALTLEVVGTTTITVNGTPTEVDVVYGESAFTGASEQNGRYRWKTFNDKQLNLHGAASQFA